MLDGEESWICPSCGEENEADLDSLAIDEAVVIDCRICCRPSALSCHREADGSLSLNVRES